MESQVQQMFHHSIHKHPMMLKETKDDEEQILCFACKKRCSGQIYVCCTSNCKFSLHQSCFDLPPEIHHLVHPRHNLTLNGFKRHRICNVCRTSISGFSYHCDDCNFNLDVECSLKVSAIKYQGHHHNLFFIENMGQLIDEEAVKCRACGTPCRSSSSMFRCIDCNFNLHLECGPLPYTIQEENHLRHPLTITYSPVLVEGEDKHTEFYCDACEEKRDPRLPIYYCSDGCPYIAELKCVISEVMFSLRGGHGEVELRTAIRQIAGKVIGNGRLNKGIEHEEQGQGSEIASDMKLEELAVEPNMTFSDACASFTEEERKYLTKSLKAAQKKKSYVKIMKSFSKNKYDHRENVEFWENDIVVNVEDQLVTQGFGPILADFFAQYGDISTKIHFESSKLKMYFFVKLCGIMNNMCHTRVVDLSEDDLKCWWKYLAALDVAGFDVQFILNHLHRVTDAYKGLQYIKAKQGDLEKIDGQIIMCSQDIEKSEAELADKAARLEALEERRKRLLSNIPVYSSSFEAECLKEASLLKWMIAGEGLI